MRAHKLTDADLGALAAQFAKLAIDNHGPEVADEIFERWGEIGRWIPLGFEIVPLLRIAIEEAVRETLEQGNHGL